MLRVRFSQNVHNSVINICHEQFFYADMTIFVWKARDRNMADSRWKLTKPLFDILNPNDMGQEDLILPASVMSFQLMQWGKCPYVFKANPIPSWLTSILLHQHKRMIVLEHYRYAAYYQQTFWKIATSICLHSWITHSKHNFFYDVSADRMTYI